MILSLLFPTNSQVLKRGVYTIRKEGDEYKIAYYNPETQESAPDQEVFKKLEQAAQPQVQIQKKRKNLKRKRTIRIKRISLRQEKVSQSWQV